MAKRTSITASQVQALQTRIVAYIYEHDMTTQTFSHHCWFHSDIVSKILRGKSLPSNATLANIARGMDMTPEALIAPIIADTHVPIETPAPQHDIYDTNPFFVDDTIPSPEDMHERLTPPTPYVVYEITDASQQSHPQQSHPVDIYEYCETAPYLLTYHDKDHYTKGLNLHHLVQWEDDATTDTLVLRFTDGTQMYLGCTQREIVLRHITNLLRTYRYATKTVA